MTAREGENDRGADSISPESEDADGAGEPSTSGDPPREGKRLLAVGGGRGGVGKSLLAQSLAVYFAQLGKSVALVDADPTGANLHAQFGVSPRTPSSATGDAPLEAFLTPTAVPGLSLFPGLHDLVDGGQPLRASRKSKFISRLRALPVDHVVVDVGPGHTPLAIDAMLAADFGICVTVPEPPAIEATYRFLRAAYRRILRRALAKDRFRLRVVDRATAELGQLPSPLDLVRLLWRNDRTLAELAWSEAHRLNLYLVVNQTRVRPDLEIAGQMSALCRRHYGVALDELGWIEFDDSVWLSVRHRKPLLVDSPTSKAARNVERIARRVVALGSARPEWTAPVAPTEALATPDHYATLAVGRSSNDEEIRRAFKRQRELYAPESLAISSLFDEASLAQARGRVEEAHDTLLDPVRRRAYDLSMYPQDETAPPTSTVPRPALAAEQLMLQSELAREIGPDTEFTGLLLRKVRESQGIELVEISSRTKISKGHLVALEEESYGELPAIVYVRGFVTELAKYLRLDPAQVQRSYLRRMREKSA